MKKIHYIVLAVLLVFGSCEQPVVLDLNEVESRLVVEAVLTNDYNAIRVSLSQSQNFYSESNFERLSNVNVWVKSDNNFMEQLSINENGVYFSFDLKPIENEEYTLTIETAEETFSVSETMPAVVQIKDVQFVPNPFWGSDSLNAFVLVDDLPGEDNFFRLYVRKAGAIRRVEYYLVDDSFGKDAVISMPVYYRNFAPGDTVEVELRHLSESTYKYYSTLSDNINSSFNSIAPGNPVSNMPPGIMGNFSVYSSDIDTIIVPERFSGIDQN